MAWPIKLLLHLYLELRIELQAGNVIQVVTRILTVKFLPGHHFQSLSGLNSFYYYYFEILLQL